MSFETAIKTLESYNIPTRSPLAASISLLRDGYGQELPDLDQITYETRIKELSEDDSFECSDQKNAKYTYLYLVQEIIKANNGVSCLSDIPSVLNLALIRQKKFIEDNQYMWDSLENSDNTIIRVREDGTIKPKKGGLKKLAEELFEDQFTGIGLTEVASFERQIKRATEEETIATLKAQLKPWKDLVRTERKTIIQAFINDVGLTEKGAPTYFYNCKQTWEENK